MTIEVLRYTSADLIDCESMIGKHARDADYDELISVDTDVYLDDELVISYRVTSGRVLALAATLSKKSELTSGKRTNGLSVKNAIYGYLPRNPTRTNYCRPSSASLTAMPLHAIGEEYAQHISDLYESTNSSQFGVDSEAIASRVLDEWRINGTMWSTLNINVNFAIKYHRDTGNWPGVFSNVFIYRQGCSGGNLSVPELRIALKQQNGACIFFHGGRLIHGVTDIKTTSKNFIRSSIVLYTMRDMQHCKTKSEERAAHANRVDEIAREKRDGNPKLRKRYAKKIERLQRERGY